MNKSSSEWSSLIDQCRIVNIIDHENHKAFSTEEIVEMILEQGRKEGRDSVSPFKCKRLDGSCCCGGHVDQWIPIENFPKKEGMAALIHSEDSGITIMAKWINGQWVHFADPNNKIPDTVYYWKFIPQLNPTVSGYLYGYK